MPLIIQTTGTIQRQRTSNISRRESGWFRFSIVFFQLYLQTLHQLYLYTFLINDLDFLTRRQIPEDFCRKDRRSGVQAVFHCNVCDCDLKVGISQEISMAVDKTSLIWDVVMFGVLTTPTNKEPNESKLNVQKPNVFLAQHLSVSTIIAPLLEIHISSRNLSVKWPFMPPGS